MNKFSIFLFIIINLSIIKINNGQFKALTDETSIKATIIEPIFSMYPSYSFNNNCNFNNKILVEVPVGITVSNFQSDINGVPFNIILKKDNYYMFSNIQNSPQLGLVSQKLTFTTSDNFQQTYQLNTTCFDIDISKLKIERSTKPISYSNYFIYYIYLGGLEPFVKSYDSISSNVGIIESSKFLDIYNYAVYMNHINQNLTQENEITMSFGGGKSFSFKLNSYYSFFEEKDLPTTHFETFFPSNILSINSNYTQMSYGYQPLFTSTLNTNIMKPYQVFNSYVPTIPLKGYKGNMTFIGAIDTTKDPINSGALINSTLTTGNGSLVDLKTFTTKMDITPMPDFIFPSPSVSYVQIVKLFFQVSFNNSIDYQFSPFEYHYLTSSVQEWPFGFYYGSNSKFTHSVNFPRLMKKSSVTQISYYCVTLSKVLDPVEIDPVEISNGLTPILKSYSLTKITSMNYLLSIDVESVNGFKGIKLSDFDDFLTYILVSGTIYNGTFEYVVGIGEIKKITIFDLIWNSKSYENGSPISLNPLIVFEIPQPLNYNYNFKDFIDLSFLKNNLDLSYESEQYNIAYLNSTEIPQDAPITFSLLDLVSFPIERDIESASFQKIPFIYNTTSGLFECKFILPKNNMFGMIPFSIFVGQFSIYSNSIMKELLVVNKTVLDYQGPIFSSFEKIGNDLAVSTTGTIGWRFNITDDLNGFESGYIKVMGSIDSSTYHFNFTIDDVIGDKFNCQYQILINITQPCITQEYKIIKVLLYDTNKIASKFILNGGPYSIINPFINLLDKGVDITILPFECSDSTMLDLKPTLLSFKTSAATIDVGATNRIISFDFSIDPGTNGIKQDQLPIIYLTTVYTEILKCNSKLIFYSPNNAVYNCSTELPLEFGYPDIIALSMYGVVNNGGYYYGYSTSDIQMVLNSNYYLDTTYSSNLPVITSSDKYYSDDNGEIVIYGRGFINVNLITITYSDSGLSPNSATTSLLYGSSAIKFLGIKKTDKLFKIKVSTAGGFTSNEFPIQPIYFDRSLKPIPTESPTTTPTTTPIPTITPIPTNPPQKCLGNPECGGKNQGYCSSTGCICYSPWIGTTCTSQIIIVPQPSINTTKPDVEIPTDNNGQSSETNSEESQKMIFKSLISLVSLRELDFNNKEVNNYKFDQWIYTPINEFKNQYFTTVSNTNITATLEWFNQSTPIQFANQNLTMNPSSIKYTIEITEYQFKSSLNQLQLVMEASLTTNSNDICTLNQFGNTSTGDNSNYLKIQIENHSLYGRFIKRAIIDNNVKSISNVLLDSSLNVIDSSSSSSLQSFIGITIPNYRNSIIVDPDFSVLIDSKSASDEDNSVCTKNNSGLTTAQLAGIIVGSIAFAAVIVITTTYFIVKNKKDKRLLQQINNKVNSLNK
ncbi:hypothetical protein ACTFIW_008404 [Dictyostelium discoideum]